MRKKQPGLYCMAQWGLLYTNIHVQVLLNIHMLIFFKVRYDIYEQVRMYTLGSTDTVGSKPHQVQYMHSTPIAVNLFHCISFYALFRRYPQNFYVIARVLGASDKKYKTVHEITPKSA